MLIMTTPFHDFFYIYSYTISGAAGEMSHTLMIERWYFNNNISYSSNTTIVLTNS